MTSSATGGYLAPTTAPVDDDVLALFMQTVIVGITGLAGNLVRREWQVEAPVQPAITVNWCAFGITTTDVDDYPYMRQNYTAGEPPVENADLITHESFDMACIFYGPQAQGYAKRLRDGLTVAQNREAMAAVGIAYTGPQQLIHTPELINDRWWNRCDITLTFNREISRRYDILSFLEAYGSIDTGTIDPIDWNTDLVGRVFDDTFDGTFA